MKGLNKQHEKLTNNAKSDDQITICEKECRYCRLSIRRDAKVCHHCGRHQNLFWQHFRIEHVGLLASIIMVFIALSQLKEARQERIAAGKALTNAREAMTTAIAAANDVRKTQTEVNIARDEINLNLLLIRASNGDRVSFFKLYEIARTKDHVFEEVAWQGVEQIITDMDRVIVTQHGVDWKRYNLDPEKASLDEFSNVFERVFSIFKPSVLGTIWKQERFKISEKLEILYKVITTTESIRVLYWACKLMDEEAKLGKNFLLDYELYAKWWEENREDYKKNREDEPTDSPKRN